VVGVLPPSHVFKPISLILAQICKTIKPAKHHALTSPPTAVTVWKMQIVGGATILCVWRVILREQPMSLANRGNSLLVKQAVAPLWILVSTVWTIRSNIVDGAKMVLIQCVCQERMQPDVKEDTQHHSVQPLCLPATPSLHVLIVFLTFNVYGVDSQILVVWQ
jgi:hypothetical protein